MAELKGEVRRVADLVLERIVSGAYPPGVRLASEVELAATYGCGRSTIREALRHLAGLGVLESRRGSGAVVLDFRREGTSLELMGPWLSMGRFDQNLATLVGELLRMRTALACEGARLAARYGTERSLEPARECVARSRGLEEDAAAHAANDLELHRALVASSGIWPAVWLSNALRQPMAELMKAFPALLVVPSKYAERMTRLLELAEAGDAEAAVALVQSHLDEVDAQVLELLGPFAEEANTAQPAGRRRVAAGLARRAARASRETEE